MRDGSCGKLKEPFQGRFFGKGLDMFSGLLQWTPESNSKHHVRVSRVRSQIEHEQHLGIALRRNTQS